MQNTVKDNTLILPGLFLTDLMIKTRVFEATPDLLFTVISSNGLI